jgi:NADPH:quinone reductase-like Zn-dependent oxidoreductase
MPKNQAAWLAGKHGPLEVGDAPYVGPGPGEILVRNHAVAVNPVDWAIPYMGGLMFSWIKPPFVLGCDLAGEVAAIGGGVTGFKVGDRVLAMAAGAIKSRNRAAEGAFQAYTLVLPRLTTIIPDHVSYAEAAVVPLGVTTAACGLFQGDLLALERPSASAPRRGQWVIIMGGATSVGANAIQLAVAAGYDVVTTASPKNFEFMKSLGAAHAFDYRSATLARDMLAALDGQEVAGTLAIGAGSAEVCLDILPHCRGRKFVANCSSPIPFDAIGDGSRLTLAVVLRVLPAILGSSLRTGRKARRQRITVKFYDASSVVDNEIGRYIYGDYLGGALASGQFRPAPPPSVVGHGLQDVQAAFDIQRKGVSASKIVVALD